MRWIIFDTKSRRYLIKIEINAKRNETRGCNYGPKVKNIKTDIDMSVL